ncbi:MAG TPA: tail fiber domain-containing protein [Thermoanaerobaculia bacterium]|nr:tail fiber domain-containing protein [Thermoanaerobaculia bacterium]
MTRTGRLVALVAVALSGAVNAEAPDTTERVREWTAPPFWTPPVTGASRTAEGRAALAPPPPTALPFIALTPCRVVDTRGNGAPLAGGFLPAATVRSYTVTGVCGIPANAQALSLNATVVLPTGPGFLVLYPQGGTFPPVSTLNFLGNDVIVNAAVVPISGAGGISMALGVSGSDVILDVNGYYAPTPAVTSLNALTGDVTLAAGSNVTLTPVGNTLTIAATGGPGGSLPSGAANQTLRNTGSVWAASSALTNDGTNVALTGTLALPNPARITSGGSTFVSTLGTQNTFVGINAGAFNTGQNNTGVGYQAMQNGGAGNLNTAFGQYAYLNGPSGNINTAIGAQALQNCSAGDGNTAVGDTALYSLTSGSSNTALGWASGVSLTSGSSNLYLANFGAASESNTTRIGSAQTKAFIAGVRGVTTGSATGIPVLIDANGQLGTVSSSASVKHDIRDMGELSARLMDLRPVAFRYNAQGEDAPVHFGLVAEEVNEVLPELVARNKAGEIETVMYHELPAMLLNEVKKLRRAIDALRGEMEALKAAR